MLSIHASSCCVVLVLQKDVGEAKYNGLLEKKWTAVIRLQRKVRTHAGIMCECLRIVTSPCACASVCTLAVTRFPIVLCYNNVSLALVSFVCCIGYGS